MEKVLKSTNIYGISWENKILTIEFISGETVEYLNVPKGIAAGMANAPSAGSYMNRYICGEFAYRKTISADIDHELKELKHFRDSSVGLWCTDRVDAISEDKKHLFFQLK